MPVLLHSIRQLPNTTSIRIRCVLVIFLDCKKANHFIFADISNPDVKNTSDPPNRIAREFFDFRFHFYQKKKKKKEKKIIIEINTPNYVASFSVVCSDILSLGKKNGGDLVLKNPLVSCTHIGTNNFKKIQWWIFFLIFKIYRKRLRRW